MESTPIGMNPFYWAPTFACIGGILADDVGTRAALLSTHALTIAPRIPTDRSKGRLKRIGIYIRQCSGA